MSANLQPGDQAQHTSKRPAPDARAAERALAESLRRDFSANVSHEMKTPLQVISGYAELMANGMVPPEDMQKFSALIYQEAQAMRALIDDVLVLSHLDEKPLGADEAAIVDLATLANHAVGRLEKPATDAGVTVVLEAQPAKVRGNETLLEQMIYNLIENAIRYNRPNGQVRVEVSTEEAAADASTPTAPARFAVARVSDTGPGIPPEAREKIFERFYRLDKSRSKETGGTGLGLAIVKHAALHHAGSVEVTSEEGMGSTFIVRLPAATERPLP